VGVQSSRGFYEKFITSNSATRAERLLGARVLKEAGDYRI
jgi:hypothetical protein